MFLIACKEFFSDSKMLPSKTNADAFRLDGATDKSKLKILNLSQMKITRIEPVYGVPNL